MADLFSIDTSGAAPVAPLVVIQVPGPPRGKGRPRGRIVYPRGKPAFIHFYTPPETVAYEQAIAWKAKAAMKGRAPFKEALGMRIFAMMPVPVSWPARSRDAALTGQKFPTTKPDGDNIDKAVLDALNGIAYLDDVQVVRRLSWKEYAEHPGLIIELYRLP